MMAKYNVGDKVRILDVDGIIGGTNNWRNGDIVKVTKVGNGAECDVWLERSKSDDDYRLPFLRESELRFVELVINKPKKSERITALESQVAALEAKVEALEAQSKPAQTHSFADSFPLTTKFNAENCVAADEIMAEIKRKANRCLPW